MCNYFDKHIPMNSRNKKLLENIKTDAEKMLSEPIGALPFSKFNLFYESGSRTEYEDEYMLHRKRLNVMTAMALSNEDKVWISALEDTLWAICDEYTWEFPAHIRYESSPQQFITKIGLFAAETGFALAEVCCLLGDKLNRMVIDRIKYEVRRRIIEPYLENDILWERSNWSAVCGGSVGCTIMYLGTHDEFESAKPKLLNSMERFLSSYNDDGCCMEGMLYWSYGFSYFCFFAQMLREYTGGEINLFSNDKVKEIAMFPQKAYISNDDVIPFADTPHNYRYSAGLFCFLAKEYDDFGIPPIAVSAGYGYDRRNRFADFIRNFFWYDEDVLNKEATPKTGGVFSDSQWYIFRNDNYFFAAKGGTNNEPHNHNDVGGFIIYRDGQYLIDDLGWPDYDKDYFTEKRYENLCASSFGHSVPIIDDKGQISGAEHSATIIACDENSFTLDLTKVYDAECGVGIERRFVCGDDCVTICDTFDGENVCVKERFVTRIKPFADGETVIIGKLILSGNADRTEISHDTFKPRLNICEMNMKPVEDVYFVDFIYNNARTVKIDFRIL